MWFNHTLVKQGEAFTNNSGLFYPTLDDRFPNWTIFSSPFKQFVYDSSISGAQVPSGIYVDGNFIPRGASGIKIDFNEGRVMFPPGSGNATWSVSGNYAVNEFNIYTTTSSDEEIVFNNKYVFNPKFSQNLSGIPADNIVAPAIFLKLVSFTNDTFEIGGMDESVINTRAIMLSDTEFNIDAVGNIFSDQKYNNFTLIPKTPLNEFGDVKGGHYNYDDLMTGYWTPSTIPYIDNVGFSKLLITNSQTLDPNLKVGFLEFKIRMPRFT